MSAWISRDSIMMFEYDPESLIQEVKKRPGIWDFESVEYRAKDKRNQLWKEIVNELMQTDVKITKSEMRELELQLQKKWKSIKDSFQKYILNPNRTKRPYIYCKQLQFLFKNTTPQKQIDAQQPQAGGSSESDDTGKQTKRKSYHTWRYKKKFKLSKDDQSSEEDNDNDSCIPDNNEESTEFVNAYDTNYNDVPVIHKVAKPDEFVFANVDVQPKNDGDDPDKLFLLSLLPHLKAVPESARLNAKMDLMQVLLKNASYSHNRPEDILIGS